MQGIIKLNQIPETCKDCPLHTYSSGCMLKRRTFRAFPEEPEDTKKEYVLIEKTGSGVENHVKRATLAIQSFSASLHSTAMLNEKVKKAMEHMIELDDVCKCELNSDYNYPDITRKRYRYQAVYDIVHY